MRRSSPLFRLQSLDEVQARVGFAPDTPPGMVVMVIRDGGNGGAEPSLAQLDDHHGAIVVIINATKERTRYPDANGWLAHATGGRPSSATRVHCSRTTSGSRSLPGRR